MMLHKLRRAMVNPEREPLTGEVEVDECFVGGRVAGLRGGRGGGDKALVAVGVEVRGAGSGRARMAVVEDASANCLTGFVRDNVAAGATVHTDSWRGYRPLNRFGYQHQPRSQRAARVRGADSTKSCRECTGRSPTSRAGCRGRPSDRGGLGCCEQLQVRAACTCLGQPRPHDRIPSTPIRRLRCPGGWGPGA